jgi:DnaA family protein
MPEQIPLNLFPIPTPSLGNFVIGPNGAALAALDAAVRRQGAEFIHLWGPPGCGRSHLIEALAGPTVSATVPAYHAEQHLYAVDDVHRLSPGEQAALFNLQNAIRDANGAGHRSVLVTSADLPPAALALREDVRTRLGWGLVFGLQSIGDDDLALALESHAVARGLKIGSELVPYMLTRLPRDIRSLLGVLDAADHFSLARGKALTVPVLRQWLQAHRDTDPARPA